jgi:hypothetical protein
VIEECVPHDELVQAGRHVVDGEIAFAGAFAHEHRLAGADAEVVQPDQAA